MASKEQIDIFMEHGIYMPSRTIVLDWDDDDVGGVEVGPRSAARFIRQLHILEQESDEPVTIRMVCPGGSVNDGMAIYDAIKTSPCHITIHALGEAASMGLIILQAADHRIVYPNTELMGHDGSIELAGTMRDVERAVEHMRRGRLSTYEILEERTGQSKAYWRRKFANDYYMTAAEAVRERLADELLEHL